MDVRPFDPSKLPIPRIPHSVLPEGPWDIEIGCGQGLHPVLYGKKNPDRHLIAIEHTSNKFEKFQRRLKNHPSIKNVTAVQANAISWISHYVPQESVQRFFILYPNPYPKKRHQNQRWHAMPFMGRMIDCLVPGGTLTLATNEAFYIDEAGDFFEHQWKLNILHKKPLTAENTVGRTHFEIKFLKEKQTCWEICVQKPRNGSVGQWPSAPDPSLLPQ